MPSIQSTTEPEGWDPKRPDEVFNNWALYIAGKTQNAFKDGHFEGQQLLQEAQLILSK